MGKRMKKVYEIEVLLKLLAIHSPTGDTSDAEKFIAGELKSLGFKPEITRRGEVYVRIEGVKKNRIRMIAAHMDTLGAMVRRVEENGRLEFVRVGGFSPSTVRGEYCFVRSRKGELYPGTIVPRKVSAHVHSNKEIEDCKKDKDYCIRLDVSDGDSEAVKKLGIDAGCMVYLDPRTQVLDSGHVKSRFLDDKAGCAAILGALKRLGGKKPACTTLVYFSNHEETGQGTLNGAPEGAEELLIMDMGVMGEGQHSEEKKVTICAKDSTGPFDLDFTERLRVIAEKKKIPHAVDIFVQYGSDAAAALQHGFDLRTALIGPGVDASHACERTHMEGIEASAALACEWMKTA